MRCCVCGFRDGVLYCEACNHNFCEHHRAPDFFWIGAWEGTRQVVKGLWQRGVAAVKQWLTDNPPRFCDGHGGG